MSRFKCRDCPYSTLMEAGAYNHSKTKKHLVVETYEPPEGIGRVKVENGTKESEGVSRS